mgnify:FL=1
MSKTKKLLLGCGSIGLCLCCAATLGALGAVPDLGFKGVYGYSLSYPPGEGLPPGGSNCANVGVSYPENPFHGWPLDYLIGDWQSVSFVYCAPYPDGSPHRGIDLGGDNLSGAYVLMTADRGIVRQAHRCFPGDACWNYGMGQMVQVEAQVPVEDYDLCVAEQGGDPEALECWADSGWYASYMHLDEVNISVDQIVHRDHRLGRAGNTGNSLVPHLYYQLNNSTEAVDPAPTMGG